VCLIFGSDPQGGWPGNVLEKSPMKSAIFFAMDR
jgi:hypothetical protein